MDQIGRWFSLFLAAVMVSGFMVAWIAGLLLFLKLSRKTIPFEISGETPGEANSRLKREGDEIWKYSPYLRRTLSRVHGYVCYP
ncbi:hypothetical protein J2045_003968 [Peteryoungia aggregata LMG 23059]|uniref:ATP synthase F0 subunit 8 n=1 Tax=Peteryoungia aggregata LMG 23059 TaxID=1368425 RepID=A0ABU0GCU3_9HYPH|nr:hypothetical protein [Peteryoungia aggregata]MDQ0422918.1 hypothetical protein [Peteryoungia aggregata LMG 23059]